MPRLLDRLTRRSYPGCDTPGKTVGVGVGVGVGVVASAAGAAVLLLAASATENILGYGLLVLTVSLLAERYFNHRLKVSSRELSLSEAALARANIDLGYAEAQLAEWCLDEAEQTPAKP